MEIYVVRHGIAIDREDPKCPPDPERYLTEEGVEKTKRVAAAVAALSETPDFLTLESLCARNADRRNFRGGPGLPQAKDSPHRFACCQDRSRAFSFANSPKTNYPPSLFVFGHAPQLDDVIAAALGAKQHITSLKKAGVALLELKRLSPPNGQLVWLAPPKLLRRAGK